MDAPKKRFIYKPKLTNANTGNARGASNFQFQKSRPNQNPFSNNAQTKQNVNVPSFGNQKRNFEDFQQGKPVLESPAKKIKLPHHQSGKQSVDNDDLDFLLDDFNEFDDDDFSKGLTSDELTLLEVEASQTAKKDTCSKNGNYSALHQLDKFLSQKTSCSVRYPEKTLDLFSTVKTDSAVSSPQVDINKFDSKHLKQLENELAEYTSKIKKMEEHAFSKDGEIKILREGLNKAQVERDYFKVEMQKIEGTLKEKQSENEQKLQREVEKLTTKLQFKEKEVREAKESRLKVEQSKDSERFQQQQIKKTSPKSSLNKMTFDSKSNPFLNNKIDESPSTTVKKESPKMKMNTNDTSSDVSRTRYSLETALRQRLYFQDRQIQKELLDDVSKIFKNLQVDITSSDEDENEDNDDDGETAGGDGNDKSDDHDSEKGVNLEDCYRSVKKLIFICSQTLQIQSISNIFSVMELIKPNIIEFLSSMESCERSVDQLLCKEKTESSAKDVEDEENEQKLKLLSGEELGRVSLLILNIITKHSIDVQESFLLALLEDQNDVISTRPVETKERNLSSDLNPVFKDLSTHIFLKPDSKTDFVAYEEECVKVKQSLTYFSKPKFNSEKLVKSLFDFFSSDKEDEYIKSQIFEIIISLAISTASVSKAGLLNKLCDCPTFTSISHNLRKESILPVLSVLQNLSTYARIEDLLCRKQGMCTLQHIYKMLVRMPDECSYDHWNGIKLEIIQTISTLIACGTRLMKFLFESECQCSCELVKSLVVMLLNESKQFREQCLEQIEDNTLDECKTFLIMRQGMSLLSHICLNDRFFLDHRADVEWQYICIINTTIHLFRRIPSICESEVTAIQDLLDMEQYDDLVDTEEEGDDDVVEVVK